MSEHFGAFIYQGNIKSCQIDSLQNPSVKSESNFSTNQFDTIESRWLRYDAGSDTFLFCAVPKGSEWRYLYSLSPKTSTLTQLSDVDTYNGQWLPGDRGYTYVGNNSNHFYFAVCPKNAGDKTNLFLNGAVANYTIAPSGDRIYITGSANIEPQSIWEYNIPQHHLRCLVPGIDHPFAVFQSIEPRELRLTAADGVAFTSFVFPPRAIPGMSKHPLVIGIPAPSAQAQKTYGTQSQLLPNLGFEVVAVNYRGVDGYGRKFSSLKDDAKAAGDVITAYHELLKDSSIDANNVFLFDTSGGSAVTTELVAQHPELWRGIVLDHSALSFGGLDTQKTPPIFYFTGDQDSVRGSLQALEAWGKQNNVKVSGIVWPHTGHYLWKTDELRETGRQILAFYYENMK